MTTTALVAEIVTTGTEILLGDIVDTNAAWIAQQLREAGINLYYKTTVGDNEPRLRGVIEQGMARSDAIIVTGGLGPTVDDITRQAIANATGRPLVLHDAALRTLQERFARFGIEMTENNRQQAYIPDGAILIENPVGTAPGFIVETGRCAVIAVPGVPREMMHLMTATVLPYLRNRAGGSAIIRRRILRTFGIGESTLDHQ
ncbi:MAG: competence/damage-inducible protein A, partial [Caldilineaceae bacterium]|nr:competence/damage-inducible protein A [Caldilineaceae bacterium]